MLAKKNKLPTTNLKYTLKKDDLSYSRFFVIRTSNSRNNLKQFATVISRKISKKAVVRNKIKRQLFESIRPELPRIKAQQTVFIPKKNIHNANFSDIKKDITQFLNKFSNER